MKDQYIRHSLLLLQVHSNLFESSVQSKYVPHGHDLSRYCRAESSSVKHPPPKACLLESSFAFVYAEMS